MKTINQLKRISLPLLFAPVLFSNCTEGKKDLVAPKVEDNQEIITDLILTFVNKANTNDSIVVRAKDSDGNGAKPLELLDEISLIASTAYTLDLQIQNNLTATREDITSEIREKASEHQFFYAFSNNAFGNPTGNGNIDNAKDSIQYLDQDSNKLPLGLKTEWTAASSVLIKGYFKIRLQHQPNLKGANTNSNDGDTDLEIEFVLNVNAEK